jgi:hypothetical protein
MFGPRFGSGCYNVKEVEVIREPSKLLARTLNVTVVLLDGTQHEFDIDVSIVPERASIRPSLFAASRAWPRPARSGVRVFRIVGEGLFRSTVCRHTLRWCTGANAMVGAVEESTQTDAMSVVMHKRYTHNHLHNPSGAPYLLYLRVKFYVSDPGKLLEEYTRYHFYLQIRKDLADGRLMCSEGSMAMLASYAVQCKSGHHTNVIMYCDSICSRTR